MIPTTPNAAFTNSVLVTSYFYVQLGYMVGIKRYIRRPFSALACRADNSDLPIQVRSDHRSLLANTGLYDNVGSFGALRRFHRVGTRFFTMPSAIFDLGWSKTVGRYGPHT